MSEVTGTPAAAPTANTANVNLGAPTSVGSKSTGTAGLHGQNTGSATTGSGSGTTNSGTSQPEYFEVPIDGKVQKMTRDELLRAASLGKGAHKRFEEAAQLRRQAEDFLGRMRDPQKAIETLLDPKLGLNEDQVREAFENWYSERFIKREQMTPEQRKLADAEQRLKKYEEQENERKQKEEQDREAELDQMEAQKLQQEIIDLVGKSGLPKTRFTTSRLAYWMKVNLSKGINAPAELIIDQVKKETNDVMKSLVQSSDGDTLVNILGEDTVKKIRKYDLERLRARRGQPPVTPNQESDFEKKPKEKISVQEYKQRLRDWK